MVKVQKQLYLESRLCYAAFALALGGNKEKSARGIYQVMCDKFLHRLKYITKLSLSATLSSPENSGLISKLDAPQRCYTLTPEFYSALTKHIESETKSHLEQCDLPYSTNAGILLLY